MGKQYGLIYSISFSFTAALGALSLEMPVPSQGHYGFQFSGC
jgi:hypothetical protein